MILLTESLHAQTPFHPSPASKKAENLYKDAIVYFNNLEFSSALEHLYKALELSPDYKDARLMLIQTYLKGGKELDPVFELKIYEHYLYLFNRDSVQNADIAYELVKLIIRYPSIISEVRKDFTLPLRNIQRFLSSYLAFIKPDDSNKNMVNYYLNETKKLLYSVVNPRNYVTTPLSENINTNHSEYFPSITADDSILLFTRRFVTEDGSLGDEDFYLSEIKNKKWQTAKVISDLRTNQNEGASTISPDGKTVIFSRCNSEDSYGKCDLYISNKTAVHWSAPQNLGPAINSSYWDSQPSLSADGNMLYFSSDRPGGYGQEDIYVSMKDTNGIWQNPVNLGPSINTSGRDTDPFIHASGADLYFTSDGWISLGGFDIYKTTLTNDSIWSFPKNLGYPLNTVNHEKGIIVSANGAGGFYYGQHPSPEGKGFMDIYSFTMDNDFRPVPASYIKGIVTDEKGKKILSADIRIVNLDKPWQITNTTSDSVNGDFLVTLTEGFPYAFYVDKQGYILKSFHYDYTKPGKNRSKNLKLKLEPAKQGKFIVFNNIFFNFNSADLLPKSLIELREMKRYLIRHPKLKIEVLGHTCDVGTDSYNQELSERRANSVEQWLVKHTISSERLSYKGYGKKRPLFPNVSEENRQFNRRTEFRIVDVK